jgi:GR25 family glycosyltransferase involved in LPS biosynthesis
MSTVPLDAYVISLARSHDRRKAFFKNNRSIYPEIAVFDAVDGGAISRADAVARGIIGANVSGYTPGAIGSAMSHRALWQRCVEHGKPILIFEDDAVLRRDFQAQLERVLATLSGGWEILRLGFNLDSVVDFRISDFCDLRGSFSIQLPSQKQLAEFVEHQDPVSAFRLSNAFGICAYAISPSGARFLLKRCFPLSDKRIFVPALKRDIIGAGTDYMMNAVYREMRAYLALPPLALTSNARAESTIQTS